MDTEQTQPENDPGADALRTHPLNTEVHQHLTWAVLAVLALLVAVLVWWATTQQGGTPEPVAPTVTEKEPMSPRVYTEEELKTMNIPLAPEEVRTYDPEEISAGIQQAPPSTNARIYTNEELQSAMIQP